MDKKLAISEIVAFLLAIAVFVFTAQWGPAPVAECMGIVLGGLGMAIGLRVLREGDGLCSAHSVQISIFVPSGVATN